MAEDVSLDLELDLDEFDAALDAMSRGAKTAFASDATDATAPDSDITATNVSGVRVAPVSGLQPLYIDFETVPDYDREHLFGLPEIESLPPEAEFDSCPAPEDLIKGSIDEITKILCGLNPCVDYLNAVSDLEKQSKKPRDGVRKAIEKVLDRRAAIADQIPARKKEMSTNPAMCRIVAVAWAVGSGSISTLAVRPGVNEINLLDIVWSVIAKCSPIVTWNGNNFDLRVLFIRSIMLGVEPSRIVDLSRYRNDSLDLQVAYYGAAIPPKGRGLKWLARALGIEIPVEDVDGSEVERLWNAGDVATICNYNASDVHVTRELHRRLAGTFCT